MADIDYIGPFEHHDVLVDGFAVPFLTAKPINGGQVHITIDRRYGIDLNLSDAEQVVPFLADAIAIAMGYTCHPRRGWDGPKQRPLIVRRIALDQLPSDD